MSEWQWVFDEEDPSLTERLAPVLRDWETLEERRGASVLKSNPVRKVISIPARDDLPALVVKRYHVRGFAERLKYLLVSSRARREWEALRAFQRGGVTGPRPLAMGEARRGGVLRRAGLIMLRIEGAISLPATLEELSPVGTRSAHELLRRVGREIGRMHAAGVDHTDLHAGNILIDREHVYLLDLHATHLGARIPVPRRIANLAKLFHSLSNDLDYPGAQALLGGYGELCAAQIGEDPRTWVDRLEQRARRLEHVRLRSRSKRCWKNSSEFVREVRGLWRIHRRREIEARLLEPYLLGKLELDQIYKDRRDQTVGSATLMTATGLRKIVVKRRTYSSLRKRLAYCFVRGPLERAWGAARALDVREIPNPRALALLTERRFLLPHQSILITEHAGSAEPLHRDLLERLWRRDDADLPRLRDETRMLAQLVRRLHDTGIYHRDLNPMNFLIGRDEHGRSRFLLVDLDSIHLGRKLNDRRRLKNLTQLGLLPEGHISTRDRLRFLRDYDRGEHRYYGRSWVDALTDSIAGATVKIIARMSRQEIELGPEAVGLDLE
ncbi:MAG: hypothetical protein KDC38_16685 [Planctomycetes bacterium]|nr:hypothetical protein [Planctomycetota bacterium]